ncbi:hypothetical protein [Mesorhizobium sp. L-2-11]|uniref:hypothetical protein n=1 Tax=Mesorhizobium sp. L-2-11 TaxID=2744521 RepID=UPI0019257640|nr:hypothetical protein [Mesorhizobium sp. L-2-11]
MFIRDSPRVALGRSFLADPMEAVGSDLSETPSSFQTARVSAELDNVLTLGPPDLARVISVERVVPYDVPAIDPRIEDAQSRAIHRGRRRALGPDPNVLNRAAFEHPAKMAFSIPFLDCAVVEVVGGFKRSSQHLNEGGCDGHPKATITPFWTSAVAVTGTSASGGEI